ncbi:MAG: XkdF-like putative serine protease domain-containing protein [Gallionella sp.]|jgi:hypothetical protein
MPVLSCGGGKFRIGSGKCMYDSKAKAIRAYRGYLGSKHAKKMIGGGMNDKLTFFVPINKVDEEQRMVYGIATTSALDKQNEIVDWGATKEALEDYSKWRNIREMHKPSAVGTAPLIEMRDSTEEVYIGAKIIDNQAWEKCKEGVYKGFSIGGEVLDRKIEINKTTNKVCNRVTKYLLNEISIVDRPANPLCRFQTVKRDTSIETITVSEDPLRAEHARLMEKTVTIGKRILSQAELEALPDNMFGLIKFVTDGDKLVKHRTYPMPDNTHAINMIRKMAGCEELSLTEKDRIHTTALSVLGKKHVEGECPYCIKTKLEGGVSVENKKVEKAAVVTAEPMKKIENTAVAPEDPKAKGAVAPSAAPAEGQKTTEAGEAQKPAAAPATAPADSQKPNIKVEEEAPTAGVDAVNPATELGGKVDRILALLENLLGEEKAEGGEGKDSGCSMEGDADEAMDAKAEEDEAVAPAEADAKPAGQTVEQVAREEADAEEDAVVKAAGTKDVKKAEAPKVAPVVRKVTAIAKSGVVSKMQAIIEPIMKENAALKARIEKLEKAPLPRKGATGDTKVKVEKFEAPKAQGDMSIEKREVTFTEALQKDIASAKELRSSGKALTKLEEAFCQRVAVQMLEEKSTFNKNT